MFRLVPELRKARKISAFLIDLKTAHRVAVATAALLGRL